jgi:hypothetical protein
MIVTKELKDKCNALHKKINGWKGVLNKEDARKLGQNALEIAEIIMGEL